MEYQIKGSVMQTLEVTLSRGEAMFSETGGMAWMKGNIDMKTDTRGGLLKGLARSLAGESMFLTTYTSQQEGAMITFTPEAPGKVVAIQLGPGQSMMCQKDAFMVAQDSVKLEVAFQKRFGAGLFGGEGFILQKLTGPGLAFVEIPGEVAKYDLAAGEVLKVDPGHVAMFEPSVSYDITMLRGVKNIFLGGEGLFLATLTGPGQVWLQSLPLSNFAMKLARYLPKGS